MFLSDILLSNKPFIIVANFIGKRCYCWRPVFSGACSHHLLKLCPLFCFSSACLCAIRFSATCLSSLCLIILASGSIYHSTVLIFFAIPSLSSPFFDTPHFSFVLNRWLSSPLFILSCDPPSQYPWGQLYTWIGQRIITTPQVIVVINLMILQSGHLLLLSHNLFHALHT